MRHLEDSDYDAFSTLESDPTVKKFTGAASTIARDRYNRFISRAFRCMYARYAGATLPVFIGRCGFRTDGDRVEFGDFSCFREAQRSTGSALTLFDAMIYALL